MGLHRQPLPRGLMLAFETGASPRPGREGHAEHCPPWTLAFQKGRNGKALIGLKRDSDKNGHIKTCLVFWMVSSLSKG